MKQKNKIFFIAGEGGHLEQGMRLSELIKDNFEIIYMTDSATPGSNFFNRYIFLNISKHLKSRSIYDYFVSIFKLILMIPKILLIFLKERPIGIISFGPLFSVPFCIIAKIFGVKSIHIETWSRFYSKSITGMILCKVCDKFYYQNKSLKNLYKKGIYSGRL